MKCKATPDHIQSIVHPKRWGKKLSAAADRHRGAFLAYFRKSPVHMFGTCDGPQLKSNSKTRQVFDTGLDTTSCPMLSKPYRFHLATAFKCYLDDEGRTRPLQNVALDIKFHSYKPSKSRTTLLRSAPCRRRHLGTSQSTSSCAQLRVAHDIRSII